MAGAGVHSLPEDLVLKILCSVSRSAQSAKEVVSPLMTCKKWQRLCLSRDFLKELSRQALCVSVSQWENGARKLLQLAADAGSLEATYILGMVLFYCLPAERTDGARLIVRAARSGHAAALYATAVITFNGSGCSRHAKDLKMGVALCARAAALGNVEGLRELGHCLLDGFGVKQDQAEGWRFLLLAYFRELQSHAIRGLRSSSITRTSSSDSDNSASSSGHFCESGMHSHLETVQELSSVGKGIDCLQPSKRQKCSMTRCIPLLSQSSHLVDSTDLYGNSETMVPLNQQTALQELLRKRKASVPQSTPKRLDEVDISPSVRENAASERYLSGGASTALPKTPPSLGIGSERNGAFVGLQCTDAYPNTSVAETFINSNLRIVRSSQSRLLLLNRRQVADGSPSGSHSPFPVDCASEPSSSSNGMRNSPDSRINVAMQVSSTDTAARGHCSSEAEMLAMNGADQFNRSFSTLSNSFGSTPIYEAESLPIQSEKSSDLDELIDVPDELTSNQQVLSHIIRAVSLGVVPQPVNKRVKAVLSLLQTSCLSRPSHPVHDFLVQYKEKLQRQNASQFIPGVHFCGRETCGRSETRPLEFWRCSCCWSARYCSRSCQLHDWKERHSHECKPSPHVHHQPQNI